MDKEEYKKMIGKEFHDLRSPLVAISGYAQLLAEMIEDADNKEMAATIYSSCQELEKKIADLEVKLASLES